MKYLIFFLFGLGAFNATAQCTGYTLTITSNDPTCYGFCDGSVNGITTGGNGGEVWTITDSLGNQINVGNGNSGNNLCDGWYYFHVIDMMGCVLEDSVELIEPPQMTIDYTLNPALCFGEASGSIFIDTVYNPTGNPNNVAYFWSPNPNSISPSGDSTGQVMPGNYTVNINDDNGCSAVFDFVVTSPLELSFSMIGGDDCVSGGDGVVYMAADGGTPSYVYQWKDLTNMDSTGNTTWGGLDAGCYEGKVIDANGCILIDTVCIGCVGIEENSIVEKIYPNPVSDFIIIHLNENDTETAAVSISDMQGRVVLVEENYTSGSKLDLEWLDSGSYVVRVSKGENFVQTTILKE